MLIGHRLRENHKVFWCHCPPTATAKMQAKFKVSEEKSFVHCIIINWIISDLLFMNMQNYPLGIGRTPEDDVQLETVARSAETIAQYSGTTIDRFWKTYVRQELHLIWFCMISIGNPMYRNLRDWLCQSHGEEQEYGVHLKGLRNLVWYKTCSGTSLNTYELMRYFIIVLTMKANACMLHVANQIQ